MYEKRGAAANVIAMLRLLLFWFVLYFSFFYLKSIGAISLRDRLQVRNSWAVPSETKE